jgi:hypothetical protein
VSGNWKDRASAEGLAVDDGGRRAGFVATSAEGEQHGYEVVRGGTGDGALGPLWR